MICTVSTVKDSLPNVMNFVRRNLASGADHMFVFLEGGDRQVLQFLEEHAHVTVVDTDNGYWLKDRPTRLNARQTMNANLINCLLNTVDGAEWLFHIDGDECLDIDKQALLDLGRDIDYVRLATKESVSTSLSEPDDPVYFKRLLADDELSLLTVLGVIEAPRNRKYFHGHVSGKIGIRPSLEYGVHIHEAKRLEGETPENYSAPWLNLLHYESLTPEEFLRKWAVHLEAGMETKFRADKGVLRGAISSVLNNKHLDVDQKKRYLHEIYTRRLEDDVPALQALGLIEEVPAERHNYTPGKFSGEESLAMGRIFTELIGVEKRYFNPNNTSKNPRLIDDIQSKLGK